MKEDLGFLQETVTDAYHKRILQSAQVEFAASNRVLLSGSWLSWVGSLLAVAGFIGFVFCGSFLVPELNTDEIDRIALVTDLDLLENIDWLEDLEILESIADGGEEGEI